MSKVEQAVACFEQGFSCSQALLSNYGAQFGLGRKLALKVASGFGGGMSHMGETCGAVTGAFMVIGLRHGRTMAEDSQSQEKTYGLVNEFVKRFKARNGSILCRELLGYDMSIPEELNIIREKKLTDTLCPKYVRDAAEIIEQIL